MKLTFLGTGTSTGVPSIGCDCETCRSEDARDKRLRVSILLEHAGKKILVDTSIDFRQQALRAKIGYLDAVLITHCHVDHVFGLDDIRPLNFRYGAMGIYADELAWKDLRRIYQYIFQPTHSAAVCRNSFRTPSKKTRRSVSALICSSRRSKSFTANFRSSLTASTISPTRRI
jgi:phosphoribosyl 1,2-cyclic phosphodiesterase